MPLKYTPKLCTVPKVDQITTPNKNIQSFFMRSDASYYADEKHRMANYRADEPIIHVVVWNNKLIVESESVDLGDFFYLTGMNTERFKSLEECVGWLGNLISDVIRKLEIRPGGSFVSLIFQDLLNRTEVLALCNLFINVLSFKGILITPRSLSQAIGTLSPNCVVVNLYANYTTVCLVEDFWMLDGICVSRECNKGFELVDSVDFVDEFNRIKVFEEKNVFSCDKCDYKDETEARMEAHFLSLHQDCGCHPEVGKDEHFRMHLRAYSEEEGDIHELIAKRMNYVLSKEKAKKIGGKVIVFNYGGVGLSEECLSKAFEEYGISPEVSMYEEPNESMITNVMAAFSGLECVKEIWMTDKEWNNAGLRVLKEKVLFII
ncbi:actin-like protein [Encephalitozoon hellem]|uniref:Actin-like protein n=1 Tax=Encephalitozoon hellem TaxID=27973 RepID=A0ABY8CJB2_ENCHE|nr:actin-like protein [Encephalitozoon hellem]